VQGFVRAARANYSAAGLYSGYVAGVHDTIEKSLCPSGRLTIGQVSSVVKKYLKDRPEEWSLPAPLLVTPALRGAFPCR